MTIREQLEEIEAQILSPKACLSRDSRGRVRAEAPHSFRTGFQRDRDRILHSKSFRRLKHKTQVFLAPYGDHYRTRLTHTLEVSAIARTIARALRLNEDLTEAIALGHDLGHTPFGHIGEGVLDKLCPGGFRHSEQSLRVVDKLEYDGLGLNLTVEVRDGISKHSKGMGPVMPDDPSNLPESLEGQIVRIADIIAYVNHDLDDSLRAGIISDRDIPESSRRMLGNKFAKRIDTIVIDVIGETLKRELSHVAISEGVYGEILRLRDFLNEQVYFRRERLIEKEKIGDMLLAIHDHVRRDPAAYIAPFPAEDPVERRIIDFIAGMTDRYAINLLKGFYIPDFLD
jgi:dGTPase